MCSSRWESNYRRERKTLSSFSRCSDFPFLLFLKTFTWFSRQIPHRGERWACQGATLFRLDQKIPPLPKPPSPFLSLFLSFCHLPVVFSAVYVFVGVFFLGSFYIFILTTLFVSSLAVMCFMETNFYIVVLTGLSKWKSWIIAHKSASDRILIISPRPDISKKLHSITLLFFLLLWADKISKKVRERQDLLGECTIRTAQTSSTLLTYCTLKLGVCNRNHR